MALVSATREQVDALLDQIEVDPGLISLLGTCSGHGVPVHIVSDGFDYCIERILERPSLRLAPHLAGVRIISSHLEHDGRDWTVDFTQVIPPCVHGCATCKPAAMERLNGAHRPMVFVGDGLSDKYAAAHADIVFAKHALAGYCDEHAISYTPYDTLTTIARQLDRLFRSSRPFERIPQLHEQNEQRD
jgi:2-hydroxy-3-keto-5-methylthiopentenyl-1-phosphate phosphatase